MWNGAFFSPIRVSENLQCLRITNLSPGNIR
jgi:hypothetical protein